VGLILCTPIGKFFCNNISLERVGATNITVNHQNQSLQTLVSNWLAGVKVKAEMWTDVLQGKIKKQKQGENVFFTRMTREIRHFIIRIILLLSEKPADFSLTIQIQNTTTLFLFLFQKQRVNPKMMAYHRTQIAYSISDGLYLAAIWPVYESRCLQSQYKKRSLFLLHFCK